MYTETGTHGSVGEGRGLIAFLDSNHYERGYDSELIAEYWSGEDDIDDSFRTSPDGAIVFETQTEAVATHLLLDELGFQDIQMVFFPEN